MSRPRFRRLTTPGAAALSVWRLDAPEAALVQLIGRPLPRPGVPALVRVRDAAGEPLDEGLLWVRDPGAAASTGAVTSTSPGTSAGTSASAGASVGAELHLHGGHGVAQALRERLLQLFWEEAAAPRDPDLQRLLACRGPLNAAAAGALLDQAFERRCAELEAAAPAARAAGAAELLRWAAWAEILEQPPRIVLAGPPNAGKSTLFNAWLRAERVTVSPYPGTTRDAVEAGVLLGGGRTAFEARLVDTAGLWDAPDALDQAAVEAAQRALAQAWRVVWVLDAAAPPNARVTQAVASARAHDLRLLHRVDLAGEAAPWSPEVVCGGRWLRGAVLREGPALIARLEQELLAPLGAPPPPGALLPLGAERRRRLRALAGAAADRA
ncbi:MAG: GTP-binding protein [Planctomycetota bacterium]|nr:MAG: GTP-binding protein [Planctomycetota bacterium]